MTPDMKHAPGPWTLDEVRTQVGRAFRIGTGEMLVAGKGCCIIYDDYPGGDKSKQREANARLIAAAPDLLDACASVWAALADNPDPLMQEIAAECRAAIAKATEHPTD
jgi:hypothetical protein